MAPTKSEENECSMFDEAATAAYFNSQLSALKSKETAKRRIKIHKYTCLRSKKRFNDFQHFSLAF
jgi:hypothetical protein